MKKCSSQIPGAYCYLAYLQIEQRVSYCITIATKVLTQQNVKKEINHVVNIIMVVIVTIINHYILCIVYKMNARLA